MGTDMNTLSHLLAEVVDLHCIISANQLTRARDSGSSLAKIKSMNWASLVWRPIATKSHPCGPRPEVFTSTPSPRIDKRGWFQIKYKLKCIQAGTHFQTHVIQCLKYIFKQKFLSMPDCWQLILLIPTPITTYKEWSQTFINVLSVHLDY